MDNFDIQEICFICCEDLQLHSTTEIKERGIANFCSISTQRNDGFVRLLENMKSVKVHERCRLNYVNKECTDSSKNKSSLESWGRPVKTKLRESDGFMWNDSCLICGEEANLETDLKKSIFKRRTVLHVSSSAFKTSIMAMIENRKDDYSRDIYRRISPIPDLIAVKAKYHCACYRNLEKLSGLTEAGRPATQEDEAMELIYDYMENSDDCQFTFTELKGILQEYIPSDKTIKYRLEEHYGNNIIISTKSSLQTLVCLRRSDIVSEMYKKCVLEGNEEEQKLNAWRVAEYIIMSNIRSKTNYSEEYPAFDKMFDNLDARIPESLKMFLQYQSTSDCSEDEVHRPLGIQHGLETSTKSPSSTTKSTQNPPVPIPTQTQPPQSRDHGSDSASSGSSSPCRQTSDLKYTIEAETIELLLSKSEQDRAERDSIISQWKKDKWEHLASPPSWLSGRHFALVLPPDMRNTDMLLFMTQADRNCKVARICARVRSMSGKELLKTGEMLDDLPPVDITAAPAIEGGKLDGQGLVDELRRCTNQMAEGVQLLRDYIREKRAVAAANMQEVTRLLKLARTIGPEQETTQTPAIRPATASSLAGTSTQSRPSTSTRGQTPPEPPAGESKSPIIFEVPSWMMKTKKPQPKKP